MTVLQVDPTILRSFAGQVDNASAAISTADVGTNARSAADGVEGSTTQWAVRQVGAHVGQLAGEIANTVAAMGVAVRGNADSFEVADSALVDSFGRLW